MARPSRDTIQSGVNGWDATANDNLIKLFDGPLPIHEHSGTEANLASTFAAGSYDNCLVWVNHTVDGWTLYHSDGSTWEQFFTRFGSAGDFLGLTDVDEADYTGHAGEVVVVNSGEDGLEFTARDFINLSDVDPANYTGQAGNAVIVNAGEDGLEFGVAPSAGGGIAANTIFAVAVGDETTALSTGTAKVTFRMPGTFSLDEIRASLTTASTTGTVTVDVNVNGVSILSTKLTIDATEETSETASTAAVLTSTPYAISDDDEVTIDIDDAGSSADAAGLKLYFVGAANAPGLLDLDDADEADYSGHAGHLLVVNAAEDGFEFSPEPVYSTSEVDTKREWVDGKTIFRKVINDVGSGTYSTGTNTIAHGLDMASVVDKVVSLSGMVQRDANNEDLPLPYPSPTAVTWNIGLSIRNTNLHLDLGTSWTGAGNQLSDAQIVIEYTKQ